MSDLDAALRAVIAGEDAAVYAYGIVAAHAGAAAPRAERALAAHQRWRDRWSAALGAPVDAAVAYELPERVVDAASARALAALVERRLVPVYADLAAASTAAERDDAVRAAAQCAQRAVRWGAPTQAFPS